MKEEIVKIIADILEVDVCDIEMEAAIPRNMITAEGSLKRQMN